MKANARLRAASTTRPFGEVVLLLKDSLFNQVEPSILHGLMPFIGRETDMIRNEGCLTANEISKVWSTIERAWDRASFRECAGMKRALGHRGRGSLQGQASRHVSELARLTAPSHEICSEASK